tara:strand:- start:203 stop:706 length:504 start_codon:yes stop_codon:yes gene_type:complete
MRKIEKAFVFDFDDTLAFTDAKVKVDYIGRWITGSYDLKPSEFNTHKLREGESFDFSDFDKPSFILNGTPTKLIDLAREVCSEGHSVFILTARTNCVASAIAEFLALHGVVASEVHCVGSGKGGDIAKAKRKVLLSIIENFDRVWFFDDDDRNIALASNLNCKVKKV